MKIPGRSIFILVLAAGLPAFGQVAEYSVKAAYLFNFTKFVEWPLSAFPDKDAPFLIGVLGEDPFGKTLDAAVKGKSIKGRSIHIKRFDGFDGTQTLQLRRCQILFIAYSEKGRLREILEALKGGTVLTVSEIEKFPLLGGMILFDQEGERIVLAINRKAAQGCKLEVNSKLLRVARVQRPE